MLVVCRKSDSRLPRRPSWAGLERPFRRYSKQLREIEIGTSAPPRTPRVLRIASKSRARPLKLERAASKSLDITLTLLDLPCML